MINIDVSKWVKSPHQMISIKWEVDNASGSTECQAWEGQHKIERLERAGYKITAIEPFN